MSMQFNSFHFSSFREVCTERVRFCRYLDALVAMRTSASMEYCWQVTLCSSVMGFQSIKRYTHLYFLRLLFGVQQRVASIDGNVGLPFWPPSSCYQVIVLLLCICGYGEWTVCLSLTLGSARGDICRL